MLKIKRRSCEIPMASMSDIAFLLIIFFITSISFIYRRGIRVSLPEKEAPATFLPERSILTLRLDRSGTLYRGREIILPEEIEPSGESAVIIRVDGQCPYKCLVSLMEHLQKKEMTRISIKRN